MRKLSLSLLPLMLALPLLLLLDTTYACGCGDAVNQQQTFFGLSLRHLEQKATTAITLFLFALVLLFTWSSIRDAWNKRKP